MKSTTIFEQYELIKKLSPSFNDFMAEASKRAHNEAEFERDLNNEIEKIAKRLDVELLFRQQYTLATGRADAVYNRFIIEYEPPGSLRNYLNHAHTQHAVQQVKDYIDGVAKAEKHERERLLGVAMDGRYFIFVRYHEGHYIVEEPLVANPASTERFLRALFSLASGRALIPENLVEDFGSQNDLSRQSTRALYNALENRQDDLTSKLFDQWLLFFGETAGASAAIGELQHKKELRTFARGMGLRSTQIDMPRFLFALHTYFSFLVKNIARLVLQAFAGGGLGATPLTTIASLETEALRRELENLEGGGIFRVLGIKNLLEGDFFSWYLNSWNNEVEDALRTVLSRLADYNPVTVQDDPHSVRDLLKKLYHYLLPREIRHDLGEFYTPDWLAERLLIQLGEPLFQKPNFEMRLSPSSLNKRLLDPACGSGTFLVLAARAIKSHCIQVGLSEDQILEVLLNNLAGIDLNPLAVMAARVNFLLAIADLLPYRRKEVEIPVYLADSILTPARGNDLFSQNRRILETAVGSLPVPEIIDSQADIERLTDLLDEYVNSEFSTNAFIIRCKKEIPGIVDAPYSEQILSELFGKLSELHRNGLNGIWARVLKNAFMPLFLEKFDYIVGNPPWINWESLPHSYRDQTNALWNKYGLFVHSGMDTILGKGKKDASTLMTYAVVDRFLKEGGKLAFVITQSVWKTSGAGQGFRRFRIGQSGPELKIIHVDDLSSLQIFEGASTRTSVFVMQKGLPTQYPVPYTYWQKTATNQGLNYDSTTEEVLAMTKRLQFQAAPVDGKDLTSAWITARKRALDALYKVLGKSTYQAHAGVCTWANAIYCLEILAHRPDGLLVVKNIVDGAKRSVDDITVELEPDLIFPLLRGRDIKRWVAKPSQNILMVQDAQSRRGIEESIIQQRYPKTWGYLKRSEKILRERSGFIRYFTRRERNGKVIETGPFYSLFNVGSYTFGTWKVAWTRVSNDIQAACFSNMAINNINKNIIPLETATMVAFDTEEEAHYFCGYINSSLFRLGVKSYSVHGTGGFASPHILMNIQVPSFNPANEIQNQIARLSHNAHKVAEDVYTEGGALKKHLYKIEAEIDRAVARLWNLTDEELTDVQTSLRELKGTIK